MQDSGLSHPNIGCQPKRRSSRENRKRPPPQPPCTWQIHIVRKVCSFVSFLQANEPNIINNISPLSRSINKKSLSISYIDRKRSMCSVNTLSCQKSNPSTNTVLSFNTFDPPSFLVNSFGIHTSICQKCESGSQLLYDELITLYILLSFSLIFKHKVRYKQKVLYESL